MLRRISSEPESVPVLWPGHAGVGTVNWRDAAVGSHVGVLTVLLKGCSRSLEDYLAFPIGVHRPSCGDWEALTECLPHVPAATTRSKATPSPHR